MGAEYVVCNSIKIMMTKAGYWLTSSGDSKSKDLTLLQ